VAIPEHIRRLRELAGHELLLVPAVAVLVRDEAGRVLLVENVAAGSWTLPGGLVEPDEEPAAAAARETREETGLEVEVGKVLGVFGGKEFSWTYPNGDRLAVMSAVFEATVVGGVSAPDGDETTAVEWFATGALPEALSARTRRVLEELW
jgi:ADP-ribose pyrophosphatase YjhB (NUDIX family)